MESAQHAHSTAKAVPLEVVREEHPPTNEGMAIETKSGRKRKLTPAIFEKIMAGRRVTPTGRQHGIFPVTLLYALGGTRKRQSGSLKQIRLQKWHEEWLGEMHEARQAQPVGNSVTFGKKFS